ncbi:MAG: hypothetical protein ACTTID_01350 [Bacillales bacterium]
MKNKKAKVIKNNQEKKFIKLIPYIRTLWSNKAVYDLSTSNKFYKSLLVVLISILVSLIPVTVNGFKNPGTNFLTKGSVYSFDEGYYHFLKDAKENNYDIVFDQSEKVAILKNKTSNDSKPIYTYIKENKDKHNGKQDRVSLEVYYIENDDNIKEIQNKIASTKVNSTVKNGRDASYIIFGKKHFVCSVYKPESSTPTGLLTGNYNYLGDKYTSILQTLVDNKDIYTNYRKTLDNFADFSKIVYNDTRITAAWVQIGTISLVNTSLIIIMGIALFIMTRGKKNPHNYIKFQQCYQIAFYSASTPALLTLILGLISAQFALLAFVITYGFRIMFFTMKHLSINPNNTK